MCSFRAARATSCAWREEPAKDLVKSQLAPRRWRDPAALASVWLASPEVPKMCNEPFADTHGFVADYLDEALRVSGISRPSND
jgi:hypothetical protein